MKLVALVTRHFPGTILICFIVVLLYNNNNIFLELRYTEAKNYHASELKLLVHV